MRGAEFDAAICLREEGNFDKAVLAFEKLSKDPLYGVSAQYEVALLNYALGKVKKGDKKAGQLGFRYRVNDSIFLGGENISARSEGDRTVRAFDNLLPSNLLEALNKAFGPQSDFWSSHRYPTDRFFSYNTALDDLKSSKRKKQRVHSSNPLEKESEFDPRALALLKQLAAHLIPAARSVFSDSECSPASAEWWAHCRRGCGVGHQLHFDLDELRVREGQFPHPLASCVVFLQGCGAPTLITNISVDDPQPETAGAKRKQPPAVGMLCPAAPGRVLVFDGGMLHGVCPTLRGDPVQPRVTLMMGLWPAGVSTTEPCPSPIAGPRRRCRREASPPPLPLGPNMTRIPLTAAGAWTQVCRRAVDAPLPAQSAPAPAAALIPCGPIWVKIAGAGGLDDGSRVGATEAATVGRFLIREDPAEIRSLCVAGAGPPVPSGPAVQSISMEELRRLRGE